VKASIVSFTLVLSALCSGFAHAAEKGVLLKAETLFLKKDGKLVKVAQLAKDSEVEILRRSRGVRWLGVRTAKAKGWIKAESVQEAGVPQSDDGGQDPVVVDAETGEAASSDRDKNELQIWGNWSGYTGLGLGVGMNFPFARWDTLRLDGAVEALVYAFNSAFPVAASGHLRLMKEFSSFEVGGGANFGWTQFFKHTDIVTSTYGYGLDFTGAFRGKTGWKVLLEARMGLRGGIGFTYLGGISFPL